jgi:hypothetical protein
VGDSWLHVAVCRQKPELCVAGGYIYLCVVETLTVGDSWLHVTVFRQKTELWMTVGYM